MYSKAILDEVQKEPKLIDSIKSVCDQYPEARNVLLGSSQLFLLQKVKESIAGRCVIDYNKNFSASLKLFCNIVS